MKQFCLMLFTVLGLSLPMTKAKAAEVSVEFFYEQLQPFGDWVEVGDYGYCWQPRDVDPDWRPYSLGRWVYTDAGWTWDSDEPFGWAVYHYGRWTQVEQIGWLWVPGGQWGPAWVSWRRSPRYVGWAPLPPEAVYRTGGGFSTRVDAEYDIGPDFYCFVELRNFGAPRLRRVIVEPQRNITIIQETRNITRITTINNIVVNEGPRYEEITREVAQPIPRLRLERRQEIDPRSVSQEQLRTRVEGNSLQVLAVPVQTETKAKPEKVKPRVERPQIDRGWRRAGSAPEVEKVRTRIQNEPATSTEEGRPAVSGTSTVSPTASPRQPGSPAPREGTTPGPTTSPRDGTALPGQATTPREAITPGPTPSPRGTPADRRQQRGSQRDGRDGQRESQTLQGTPEPQATASPQGTPGTRGKVAPSPAATITPPATRSKRGPSPSPTPGTTALPAPAPATETPRQSGAGRAERQATPSSPTAAPDSTSPTTRPTPAPTVSPKPTPRAEKPGRVPRDIQPPGQEQTSPPRAQTRERDARQVETRPDAVREPQTRQSRVAPDQRQQERREQQQRQREQERTAPPPRMEAQGRAERPPQERPQAVRPQQGGRQMERPQQGRPEQERRQAERPQQQRMEAPNRPQQERAQKPERKAGSEPKKGSEEKGKPDSD